MRLSTRLILIVVLTINSTGGTENISDDCIVEFAKDGMSPAEFCPDDPQKVFVMRFHDAHFQRVPKIFDHFPNLRTLDLSHAYIEYINNDTFQMANNLEMLEIDGNRLSRLPSLGFQYLINLHSLDISKNNIETLDQHAFSGLSNLTRLDLSYNKIKLLDAEIFAPLTKLVSIRFTDNKIQFMNADMFEHNVNLRFAYFSSNDIISIDDNTFVMTALSFLDLAFNDLNKANMKKLNHLKTLTIANNKLNLLIVPPTVEELHAENNRITDIKSEQNSKLKNLFLASNKLFDLQNFKNFPELLSLDLSFNNFQKFEFLAIKELTHLKELRLTGMKLSEIDANDVIKMLPNLKMIALSTKQWPIDYVKKLETELKEFKITLVQNRTSFPNDGTTNSPTTMSVKVTSKPTAPSPTNTFNRRVGVNSQTLFNALPYITELKQSLNHIEGLLGGVENRAQDFNEKYEKLVARLNTMKTLLVLIFVTCLVIVVYKLAIYLRLRVLTWRFQRTPSSDNIFGEQDL